MKQLWILVGMALSFVPCLYAQGEFDRINVGTFADYFRSNATGTNMFGVGGRVGVTVFPHVKLEAEMAYDFQQEFASGFTKHRWRNHNVCEYRRARAAWIVWPETGIGA